MIDLVFIIMMVIILFSFLLLGFISLISYKNYRNIKNLLLKTDQQNETKNHPSDDKTKNIRSKGQNNATESKDNETISRDLNARESENRESLMIILEKMGSHPKLNEDNNIEFAFQGENFLILFNGAFLRIWDLSWYSIKVTDDNFPIIRDAANYANFSFGPSIVMHSPDENSNVVFSSRLDIPFSATMHDPEGYIKAILDPFFGIKHSLRKELEHLKDNPKDRTMQTNPIGFDTASLSDPDSPQAN